MHVGDDMVRVLRDEALETEHRFAWCVTTGTHVLCESATGVADTAIFARSATKPLQALPAVRAQVIDRLGLDDRHLARACASHGGGPEAVRLVREVLEAAGAREGDLACGPLAPRDPAVAAVASDEQLLGQARAGPRPLSGP